MCAIGIEEAPTVRAKLLDNFLRGHRALRDGLFRNRVHDRLAIRTHSRFSIRAHSLHLLWLNHRCLVVGSKILHHPLRNEYQSSHNAEWQQHPQRTADEVNPEVPNGFHLPPGNATDKRYRESDSHRRRGEIVVSQTSHLGEVAHRRLTRISLPVRIRGKRSGRVEGHMRRVHRTELLRVKRQETLEALDQIQQDHRHYAEQKHRDRILRPAHFMILIHSGNSI